MKRLDVARRTIESTGIRPLRGGRRIAWPPAKAGDCSQVLDEECCIYEDGHLKVVHAYLNEGLDRLLAASQSIDFQDGWRTSGLKAASRIFGFRPRNEIRSGDFCSIAALSRENPAASAELISWAAPITEAMRQHHPAMHARQAKMLEEVRSEWRLPNSIFTSGIINRNSALSYHTDFGNFTDAWSGMVVLARDIDGGNLALPEYDLELKFRTGSLLMFDGQGLLHGVTPIIKKTPYAYRYSIVFYALSRMRNCLCPAEEIVRIRKVKTERELKRGGKR